MKTGEIQLLTEQECSAVRQVINRPVCANDTDIFGILLKDVFEPDQNKPQ